MRFKLIQLEEWQFQEWDNFVDDSHEGTIFHKASFLRAANTSFEIYYVVKGNSPQAGVVFTLDPLHKHKIKLHNLIIYNGVVFSKDAYDLNRLSKAHSKKFQIMEFIINELTQKFNRVELRLSSEINDIRPFLWHNYHSKDFKDKFIIDVRYTSYLNIHELVEEDNPYDTELFKNLGALRKRNIKEAEEKGAFVEISTNVKLLIDFYKVLIKKQKQKISEEKLSIMENLTNDLLKMNMASIYEVKNEKRQTVYIIVYCWDKKRAYYLFGAGNPVTTERYQGTLAHWRAFKDIARNHNIKEIDWEGVNSPYRGSFKLSFGGKLITYYTVKWDPDQT